MSAPNHTNSDMPTICHGVSLVTTIFTQALNANMKRGKKIGLPRGFRFLAFGSNAVNTLDEVEPDTDFISRHTYSAN